MDAFETLLGSVGSTKTYSVVGWINAWSRFSMPSKVKGYSDSAEPCRVTSYPVIRVDCSKSRPFIVVSIGICNNDERHGLALTDGLQEQNLDFVSNKQVLLS